LAAIAAIVKTKTHAATMMNLLEAAMPLIISM
jgi:hypothetical protein